MKNFIAIFGLLAIGASAQDNKIFTVSSPVMGKTVKGAPYSGEEITESLQVLADGTRISHQNQVTVYRDGEGRVRRESPEQITIFDPVEGVSYRLNPKQMTAVKSSMGTVVTSDGRGRGGRGGAATGEESMTVVKVQNVAEGLQLVEPQAATATRLNDAMITLKTQLDQTVTVLTAQARGAGNTATENLGQKTMEGVSADGTRTTETIEAGSIGNDRPIQVVNERWVSADLKTPLMTRHSDPRTGEETFRLTNVQRGEPGSDLFMLPPGYQLVTSPWMTTVKKDE
jgi:hypothetical protein